MNWFQKMWRNPNTAIFVGATAPALMTAFPQYAAPIAAVGTVLGLHGGLTPEAPPSTPPASSPTIPDYATLVAAIIEGLRKK